MKKCLSFLLALSMVLMSTGLAFAGSSMEFTGEQISLSLEQAVTRMTTTGPAFASVLLTKDGNDAAAKGNFELISGIKEAHDASKFAKQQLENPELSEEEAAYYQSIAAATAGYSLNNLTGKQATLAKEYYAQYAPIAYEAGINGIKSNVVKAYYGLLLSQENYRILKETTSIKKALLDNTNKKYNVGMVSRMEVLQAENAYASAKQTEDEALTSLNTVKMSFNMAMNFDLMQNVKLTDPLVKVAGPSMDLDTAIASAKENRNEIVTAKYNMDNADLKFSSVFAYPKNSATYMSAKVQLDSMTLLYTTTLQNVEMDLRKTFMEINDLANAIKVAQSTYANAKEYARLTQLQYNAGMCTMTDLLSAQNTEELANMAVFAAIMNYDIAVYTFQYNSKCGMM